MSSWKQYGGTNKRDKANDITVENIITNNLSLLKPYQGNLFINGSVIVYKDMNITGNSIFDTLEVNGVTVFNGIVNLKNDFIIAGNIDSEQNVNVANNIICGNILYFNQNDQYMYGDSSGIGINKHNPNAILDISTNLINGFWIKSSQDTSISTLVQNNANQGILLSGNTNVEYIDFFNETPLNSQSVGDARISYKKGGLFQIDVSKNINLFSGLTVSDRGLSSQEVPHLFNETAIIYDTSNGTFFGNIYNQSNITGSAFTLVTNDICSNTFLHITTPQLQGTAIGGGTYPNDPSRSMLFIGLTDPSGNMNESQMIVSGNNPVKYQSTIGINTYQPRTEKYIVDINGPLHIDNGDITVINQNIPFQLTSMSISAITNNKIIALGSSYDITIQSGYQNYRERIIISNDYGSTWSQIDISNSLLYQKANFLTSIYTYDSSFAFLTGNLNTLFYTTNGGYTWNNIITSGISNLTYYNVQIGNSNTNGNRILYFSSGSSFYYSDFSFNSLFSASPILPMTKIDTSLNNINSMITSGTSIYLAGSQGIVKYNNIFVKLNSYLNNYTYNAIHNYNTTVIAVGNGIISYSSNSGGSWTDISFSAIQFNSIYCYDISNAVAVGSGGNIWITQNGGISWQFMPDKWLNASGKKKFVVNNTNTLQNIVMPNSNTIIITNTLVPYVQGSQYGSSQIINVFTPNFVNRSNNHILDVSGNMQISGDIHINDKGSLISNNELMSIFDASVQTITIGANTSSSIIGGQSSGTTEMKHNVMINGNLYMKGYSNFVSDVSLNGNLVVNRNTKIYGNIFGLFDTSLNGNLSIGGNIIVNPLSTIITNNIVGYPNSTLTIGYTDYNGTIRIGGPNTKLILKGNPIIEESPIISNAPTFLLNAGSISNASAGGSGINFFDNSGIVNYMPENAGYIHLGNDLQSYVFKATNIGINGKPISGNTILRLGVNALTINNPITTNQIIALQRDSTYQNTQIVNGTNFGSYGDANYSIVSYNLDISNIMLKQYDSIVGSQILQTNIIIGNSSVNNNLFVYGNVGVTGYSNFVSDVSLNGNLVVNRNTKIYGNIFGLYDTSLNGNLNIGANVYVNGYSNFVSDVSLNGNLVINRNTKIYGNIFGLYDTSLNGNLSIGGNIITRLPISTYSNNSNVVITSANSLTGGILTYDSDMWYNSSNNTLKINNLLINSSNSTVTTGYNVDVNGSVQATSYNATSDYRLKENIISMYDTSFSINQLNPVFYTLKGSQKQDMGFLAHEVAESFPFLVSGEKDGKTMQSLNYNGFISLLVKEIQDLKKQVKQLQEKINL